VNRRRSQPQKTAGLLLLHSSYVQFGSSNSIGSGLSPKN
jgi:hypothetical protein